MRLLVILFLLMVAGPAYALSIENGADLMSEMMPLPKPKEGAVPWQLFITTKEKEIKVTLPDGGDSFEVTPVFDDKLKELNGKEVTLFGFMFPLEQTEKQSNFLIGPFPPSCPFHYHVPPSLIVEVKAKKPLDFSWDEITIKGTLALIEKDSNGSFYLLKDAVISK